jgi:glycogen phosphorylase
LKVETNGGQHVFEAQVYLNDLDPDAVRVELYADGVNGGDPLRQEMELVRQLADTSTGASTGASTGYAYRAQVPATRPAADYTARVTPRHAGVAVPLEAAQILWQR